MKVVFIYLHSTDEKTSSVEYWRLAAPAKWLKNNTYWDIVEYHNSEADLSDDRILNLVAADYEQVLSDADAVISSYTTNKTWFSLIRVLAQKYPFKHYMNFDDDILSVRETNPVYKHFQGEMDGIIEMLKTQPNIITTNPYLRKVFNRVRAGFGSIDVIPNLVDPEVYAPKRRENDDVVTIAYQGGATHKLDLWDPNFVAAIAYILGKYRNKVRFELFGQGPDDAFDSLPNVFQYTGSDGFYQWVELWKEHSCRWDIGVAPLENIPYNWAKSPIKWIEYAMAGVPAVMSAVGPYNRIQDGKDGFVCQSTAHWIDKLSLLVESAKLRKQIAKNAKARILKDYGIENNGILWKNLLTTGKATV